MMPDEKNKLTVIPKSEKKVVVQRKKAATKTRQAKKKWTPFIRNLVISGLSLVIALLLLGFWFIVRPDNKTEQHNLFNIEMISELTTLECRYHNVSVYEYDGEILGGILGSTSRYVWFEYDVIIDVGIDIHEVRIEDPTDNGVVRIYLPPAKILGAAEDKSTISKPVYEIGVWGSDLTADEERQIIHDGIEKLKNDSKTQEVINEAYNSAKDVLEQYVVNMGKLIGEEYVVEWIKVSDSVQTPTDSAPASTETSPSSTTDS